MRNANTDTAIRVRGLHKSYGGVRAVDGIDLDVSRGEVFALLGPNGAGKTTTVEVLEGYRRRDAGEVSVLGVDPAGGGKPWRSRLGIVHQEARDLELLTVDECLRHFAGYYPAPRDPDETRALVGLDEQGGSRVGKLSGGQRRRLDVALGILGNPELIFLDEPTTGFDPEVRRQFWKLVGSLADGGTTVLLTTHYLDEAEALADRVGVIARGRLVALDTPDRLGGRGTALATVRWETPGGPQAVTTAEPTRVVTELARAHTGEIPGLVVSRPSLEDSYLKLIGEDR
jgi:ABC-2 type transport system ATP-binding protein